MGTATKHTVAALVVGWVFAAGIARAETVEMFGCGVVGRMATIEPGGLVTQHVAPADMARTYRDNCDFVALGRFTSIAVEDYASKVPQAVVALFVIDEALLGSERTSVEITVSGGMLVEVGETINRNTAQDIYQHHDSLATGISKVMAEDLRDLKQGKAALMDVLPELERNIENYGWGGFGLIDRATALRFALRNTPSDGSSTFYLEGGAIHPDTQFLLGLDVAAQQGHEQLTPTYTLLHWGDYAAEVAGAIRAAAE